MWRCFCALWELQHHWQISESWNTQAQLVHGPELNSGLFSTYQISRVSTLALRFFYPSRDFNSQRNPGPVLRVCDSCKKRAREAILKPSSLSFPTLLRGCPVRGGIWDSSFFLWHAARTKGPGIKNNNKKIVLISELVNCFNKKTEIGSLCNSSRITWLINGA